MRLLIDLGNSRLKWAWQASTQAQLLTPGSAPHQQGHCTALLTAIQTTAVEEVWLASVAGVAADRVAADIAAMTSRCVHRAQSPAQLDGVVNAYAQPERLGVDRFLALLAARQRYRQRALVVVDAGTALTIDALSADGQHLGGSIAPGLGLMRQSLGAGTASLGASNAPPPVALTQLGRDTAHAIECGILAAACAAVQLRLQQLAARSPLLLLSGGDAPRLANALAAGEVLPLLVLEGLARYADCSQT